MKYLYLLLILFVACTPKEQNQETSFEEEDDFVSETIQSEVIEYSNPPAKGFDSEGSDMVAILIADKAMMAMGGRQAWDETRYLTWNFFQRRKHIWDKFTGDVRIESPGNDLTILMNIKTKAGKVMKSGKELTDSVDYYLDLGYKYWVNDSYWLVMPYKLKDSGVTLKYLEEDEVSTGSKSDVLSLSFKGVGVTPQNQYKVWVDVDTRFVTQWEYYRDSTSKAYDMMTPWEDYKQYGKIMLSGSRGKYTLSDIDVLETVPEGTFTSF